VLHASTTRTRKARWFDLGSGLRADPLTNAVSRAGATGLEPATSGVQGRRRCSTSPDAGRQTLVTRPHSTTPDTNRRVRSHRARTAVVGHGSAARKVPANTPLLVMERAGLEPATSGLQTHPITRPHLTRTNRIGMFEPKTASSSNVIRHGSTAVRSHRARTAAAEAGNNKLSSECGATLTAVL
jgi:hypothetical protein